MQLPRPRVTPEGSLSARAHGTVARTSLPHIDFEREPGAASRPLPRGYQRRTPETTALYAVIRDNLETFLDDARQRSVTGLGYPEFIPKGHKFRTTGVSPVNSTVSRRSSVATWTAASCPAGSRASAARAAGSTGWSRSRARAVSAPRAGPGKQLTLRHTSWIDFSPRCPIASGC
jgi:hypothetical protein